MLTTLGSAGDLENRPMAPLEVDSEGAIWFLTASNSGKTHRLYSAFAKPWFPDGPESPFITLFKFIPIAAQYWDAPHSRTVR